MFNGVKHLKSMASERGASARVSARRGGMDDYTQVRPSKKRRVAMVKLETMIALDTLKDIHPTSPNELWDMVHLSELKLKRNWKDVVTFRQESAKELADYLGVSHIGKSETVAFATDPMTIKIEKDTLLWRQMLKWMTNSELKNNGDLLIVLDGLVNDVNESGFLRSIMLHALFHAMIVNMQNVQSYLSKHLNKHAYVFVDLLPYSIKQISILNGNFQQNDGMQLAPFFQKFIQAIYFEKYYGEDPSNLHWAVKGHVLRKQELEAEMKLAQKKMNAHKIQDMAVRNFVRDAWKADIAIKHNAVFFTCDQNAWMYHQWICNQEILDRNAIALFLGDNAFVCKD